MWFDRTAVLVRNSCNLRIKRVESRSRALIATLHDEEREKNLYVCSVHLNADSGMDLKAREHQQKQRQSQLKSLLKRINYACKLDNQIIKESPILVAGDFNMLRENPLHELLVDGSLTTSPSAFVSLHDAYFEAERHKKDSVPVYRHPEVPVEAGTNGTENALATIAATEAATATATATAAVATKNDRHHLVKTYKGGAILDYIWTSEHVNVVDTLLYHSKSSTVGTEKWPCHDHPSDHLPIGIDLEWN